MYFVLKILKIFYLNYSALHVSDTIVPIIRSFSAAHAVSGPVWCLVRCVLQSCYVVQHSRTGLYMFRTPCRPETACAAEELLMMDKMVSETCRVQSCYVLQHSRTGGHNEPSTTRD